MTQYRLLLLLALLTSAIKPVFAADTQTSPWGASVGLASENNQFGIKNTRGDLAIFAGISYTANNGVYTAIDAREIDYVGRYASQYSNEYEIDYVLGFYRQFNNDWAYHVSIGRYTYETKTSQSDYNYTELLISADYRNRLTITLGELKNFYHYQQNSRFLEINAQHPIGEHWLLYAGLGYINLGDINDQSYAFSNIGIGRRIGGIDAYLSYLETSHTAATIYGSYRSDGRTTVSLSYRF